MTSSNISELQLPDFNPAATIVHEGLEQIREHARDLEDDESLNSQNLNFERIN